MYLVLPPGSVKMSLKYRLPALLTGDWPFERVDNPHYLEVAPQSLEWIESFNLFPPEFQQKFRGNNTGLLASFTSPHHSKVHLRIVNDVLNLFWFMDELSYLWTHQEAQKMVQGMIDFFRSDPFVPCCCIA